MSELAIIIPTRTRPTNAERVLTACENTCTTYPTIILAIDADDPDLPAYTHLAAGRAAVQIIDPPTGHVGAINTTALLAMDHSDPYAIVKLDDDHQPRTHGWDHAYLTALHQMGTGVVYGDDQLQGANLPTAPGITTDIIRALGFVAPPELGHLYCDNFWRDLATQAGCLRYLPDIVVEHLHPGAGKATWDTTYARVNSPERYDTDARAYRTYTTTRMATDVDTVRTLMAAHHR
jgi:hypothetical protein